MKKNYYFINCVLAIIFSMRLIAQPCYSPSSFGSLSINSFTNSMTNINTCTYGGEYNTLTIGVGGIYTFSVGTIANYLTLSTGVSSGSIIGGLAPITATLTPGTYYLHASLNATCGISNNCNITSYSNTAIPGSPTITGQPSNLQLCSGANGQLVMNSSTNTTTYQWQVSIGGGPFTNLTNTPPYSGVTTKTLVITSAQNSLNANAYQCVASNSVSSVSTNSVLLTVIQSTTIPLVEDFNASTIFPTLWQVDGSNPWYVFNNHGTGGTNGMTRNLFGSFATLADAQTPNVGVATPSTALKFDYRIMDWSGYPGLPTSIANFTNDTLKILLSNNCGQTFTVIGSIDVSNHIVSTNFVTKTYPLGAYAGQNLIVRFRWAHDPSGSGDYYIDIDNINISSVQANDAGITNLVQPAAGQPCYSATQPVVVQISNFGNNTLTNVPVGVNITGALTSVLSNTYVGSIPSGTFVTYTVGVINMSTAGVYNFKAFTKLSGDPTLANDTLLPVQSRTVVATLPLPYFEDFNASLAMPATWSVSAANPWFVTSNHGTGGSNGMNRNLFSTILRAEANLPRLGTITPSTAISFDYRYVNYSLYPSTATPTLDMNGDSLRVMISTNCGATFTTVGFINANNHAVTTAFANKTYTLGAYAGNDAIIKFVAVRQATNSSADYYVDVDNINLFNLSAIDGGVSALVTPNTSTCTSANQPVIVNVTNYGTGPISNFPVNVVLSGPANQTITANYTGTLASGATATFNVGNANLTAGGTYSITSSTNVSGDGNNTNNSNSSTFTTANPIVSISSQTAVCLGNGVVLNILGTATSYTWNTGSNSQSITVTPSVTTTYSATGSNSLNCVTSNTFALTVINPTISGIGASGCGTSVNGTLTANAFGTSTINWYATPTSTTILSSGNTYTLNASNTTTVYAQSNSQAMSNVGLATNTTVSGGGQQQSTNYNIFDVQSTCIIQDVLVYPGATGNVVFDLRDNAGTLLQTATVPVTTTLATVIPLNFTVNPGFGYRLGQGAGSVSMYRTSAASNIYPFTLPGVLTITNSAAGNTFYYFGYNWTVLSPGCTSSMTPVVFTVTPSASITAASTSSAVCAGGSVTLTANGSSTYTWSPSAQTTSVIVVTPTVNSTYTVIGGAGTCTGSATRTITVNPSPTLAVSPSATICSGTGGITTFTIASAGNTFTWSNGSNNVNVVINNPSITTVYSATATNAQGCRQTATTSIIVQNCQSIAKNSLSDNTLVYPNPTSGIVNISISNGTGNYSIEVYDVTGRLVLSNYNLKPESTINLKELANGMYNYTIRSNDNKQVIKEGKIVKQ